MKVNRAFASAALLVLLTVGLRAQQHCRIEGTVVDRSGTAVAGATVQFTAPGFRAVVTSSDTGQFEFDGITVTEGVLLVEAGGFSPRQQSWSAASSPPLRIVMDLATVKEQVSVTATRTELPMSDIAASVQLFGRAELMSMGGLTMDDVLHLVPGFTLFRRSGSLVANPTSQGVSLRGLGASGASRALVLYHGVPLNDSFGGWVYWSRVPRISVSEVEVLRGGASDLYGTEALGGMIDIRSRKPSENVLSADVFLGSLATAQGSVFAARQFGPWASSVTGDAFRSDGYLLVRERNRGSVDTPAASNHRTGEFTLERLFSWNSRAFVTGSLFHEERNNGTQLQRNSTHIGALVAGATWHSATAGNIEARAYVDAEQFLQTFSSISPDRNQEALVRTQTAPAQRIGGSAYWSRPVRGTHTLVVGIEMADVRGRSDDLVFTAGRPTSREHDGGRQRIVGVFGEDVFRIRSRWLLTASIRLDRWRNFDAFLDSFPLPPGPPSLLNPEGRSDSAVSPRVSLLHQVSNHVLLAASVYRAFRTPTLNELYRPFRVGNVMTLANPALSAEHLTGGEASAIINGASGRLDLRGTFFWAEVHSPIANVTLSSTPQLITRQRQNLGLTRSRGFETGVDFRANARLKFSASYQFVDAAVLSFPSDITLQGRAISQVPHHQVSSKVLYSNQNRLTFAVQARWVGMQFDDDQNRFPLDSFFTLDAFVSRWLNRFVELYIATENLFNQRYMVSRTPTISVGPPLIVRGGIRLGFSTR